MQAGFFLYPHQFVWESEVGGGKGLGHLLEGAGIYPFGLGGGPLFGGGRLFKRGWLLKEIQYLFR